MFEIFARTLGSRSGIGFVPVWLVVSGIRGNRLQQVIDDAAAVDAFGLGVEVGDEAVPQDRMRERLHVVDADRVAAIEQRARLAGGDQVLRGARAGAPA